MSGWLSLGFEAYAIEGIHNGCRHITEMAVDAFQLTKIKGQCRRLIHCHITDRCRNQIAYTIVTQLAEPLRFFQHFVRNRLIALFDRLAREGEVGRHRRFDPLQVFLQRPCLEATGITSCKFDDVLGVVADTLDVDDDGYEHHRPLQI